MKKAKKDIFLRVNLVLLMMLVIGAAIIIQGLKIQFVEGNHWNEVMNEKTRIREIKGELGDILSQEGEILVTSLPYYEVAMDPLADGLKKDSVYFKENIGGLCQKLARHFRDKSTLEYRDIIEKARKKGSINRNIVFDEAATPREVENMLKWPIFEKGQFGGGFIRRFKEKRILPHGEVAKRTLGYIRSNLPSVGISDSYQKWLEPDKVSISQINVAGNNWIDLDMINDRPADGGDVYTTLNLDLQKITHEVLNDALIKFDAAHGCVVVLEVETGKIKALSNLSKVGDGIYKETYNHAVGRRTPPGSVFKTAVALALLSDNKASLNTFVEVGNGKHKFYDVEMKDDHKPLEEELTFQRAFETSSNVGIAKLANDAYPGKQGLKQLLDRLEYMMLDRRTGVKIAGEEEPHFTRPNNPNCSGVTVPFTAIGYEVLLTPLQQACFYNAIANDGKLMQPYIVSHVEKDNKIVLKNEPTFVKQIAELSNVRQIQKALRGVVVRGTAKGIRSDKISMAGKTGTALISKPGDPDKKYQSSFIGYFPAEKPKYTVAVIIAKPSSGEYYGSQVAAPIFKEIAERCYIKEFDWQEPVNDKREVAEADRIKKTDHFPPTKTGYKRDIQKIYDYFDIPYEDKTPSNWIVSEKDGDQMNLRKRDSFDRDYEGRMPNVIGMGLRDAIFVLENRGFKVSHKGVGKILKQSIPPGESIQDGTLIKIFLG